MRYLYCENCQKKSGYKRSYGWGTFFAILLTAGLWFLALPFYPLRCMNCGNESYLPEKENVDEWLESAAEKMKKLKK